MSENKKPENLLAEILYSRTRVRESYYEDGKYAGARELSAILDGALSRKCVESLVTDALGRLLGTVFCGITVEAARTSDSDTVIRVYKLPDHQRRHRLYYDRNYWEIDPWLHNFLASSGAIGVVSAEAAYGSPIRGDDTDENDTRGKRDELEPCPTDHIPALRGLFALARGDYATVSAEDLNAAVDAGYVHPDILACVADEIAYATEADVSKAYQKALMGLNPMETEKAD
ncbi:hypothetical protein Kim5_CH00787 [Rhizobium sp. Kim5]|uniref:hypothetical protein n=1 Tax=Rhizobium sp. Kim5 TaxID=2020311 RepID=UPI000A2A1DF5|nr:hypothetical protein [Rhizobium sp. Kim5]ARQ56895.1 hypothetical protein Kim5_CH00787 [Rhizobium sp. Kim5]